MLLRGHDGSPSLGASALVCVYVYIYIYFAHRSVLQQVASHRLRRDEVSSAETCRERTIAYRLNKEYWYLRRSKDDDNGAQFVKEPSFVLGKIDEVDMNSVKLLLVGDDRSAILYDRDSDSCLGHDGTSRHWIHSSSLRFFQIPEDGDATDCLFFKTEDRKSGEPGFYTIYTMTVIFTRYHMLSTTLRLRGQKNKTTLYLDADGGDSQRIQLLPETYKAEDGLIIAASGADIEDKRERNAALVHCRQTKPN
eukprot:TRINITY_DN3896_c0_g1_i3.p1 TRINITY_DN3896_c0_g1~~TRINITY_DN3896_c0_g1_i3.p1  ORF type:complete len:251 (+),score=6.61 TRINITY_DN3896_c0_g1_i3:48-800(+)